METCRAHPGEITLITLGPLTNVAQALQQCPDLPKYAKRVGKHKTMKMMMKLMMHPHDVMRNGAAVSMGGVLNEPGNKTPVAEANFNK